ncbi:MAG: DNA polymerase III subunit delta [Lachnospiraceae bacterium]|nr:DNA polymerase III subunit delta [Lachnospiraceae bacterium]
MSELKQILGNKQNIEHFREAVRKGKVSHAYIIDGPEGIGKKTFAGYIAAALLCEKGIEEGPCMTCPSCVKADTHNHPDIIWVEHEKPTVLSIDEIRRQVIDTVDIIPFYGPFKIYIIKDAQLLNDNGQNALLKTLEEPPEYALFFLLTDNCDKLLDTVRSRCIKLRIEPLPKEVIIRELEKEGAEKALVEENAGISKGNLGLAKRLTDDEEKAALKNETIKALKNMSNLDALEIFQFSADLEREDGAEVLSYMRMWYRDVAMVKNQAGSGRLYFEKEKAVLKRQADQITPEGLGRIFDAIAEAGIRLDTFVKCEAVFEALFLKIREELRN